ncbi:AMP-binding enzyme [Seiridium cupressi]
MVKTAKSVAPGKRSVLITTNPDLINPLEDLSVFQDSIKIITSSLQTSREWLPFEGLMSKPSPDDAVQINGQAADKVIDGFVLFTSGTTSLPKGCFRKYPALNYFFETSLASKYEDQMVAGDRVCGVLPNNHAMGHFWVPMTHAAGAAMVYPGPTFQTDTMLKTLYRERISHTVLVPTMMYALNGLKAAMGHRLDRLKSVLFGGAVLTPDNLRSCINELGSKGVENAFGMTEYMANPESWIEGIIVRSTSHRDPTKIIDGEEVSVGWVQSGVSIRVADPNTNEVLPRNTLGELQGSASSIDYYIGGVGKDSFYTDPDGRLWFKTGDQARMDHSGRLFITGRYKDMIIRGGENMSPAAIEVAISKNLKLAALNPQVVAAPDSIAGEVPVAVVMGVLDANTRELVQNAVLKLMGAIYVPEDVVSLQQLGLKDYPRTMAGKIQKTKLASLVKKYRADREILPPSVKSSELATHVREIWARAVGLEPSRLSLDAQIGEFADSITVMRVRDAIRRETGKTLSLVDMANAGTVSGQVDLLRRQTDVAEKKEDKRMTRDGPPSINDMQHLIEEPNLFEPTKELVVQAISPYGLNWDDVEDIVPAYDYTNVIVETRLIDSWGFKFAMVSKMADKQQLRKALEMILQNNRTLASFLVRDLDKLGSPDSLHVLMRHNKKLFDQIFQDGGKLRSAAELRTKSLDYGDQVIFPGPLARAVLYDIEEDNMSGAVLCLDHAVIDASTGLIFSADLDKALCSTSPLSEHVDYKLWADSYHNQRTSAEARAAAKWHVKRLEGLEKYKAALWPPYKMPMEADEYIVESSGEDAVHHSFDAPAIHEFRRSHSQVTATVVMKTAVTLLTIHQTGQSHALFANNEAARTTFPFLPRAIEATGHFEATDVSGPTFHAVINLVEYSPDKPVLTLLERMQDDQLNLTKYAAAPVREIMSSLGRSGHMIPEILGHHLFNWTPGMGTTGTNPNKNYEMISAIVRPRQGLIWNAGLGGPDGNTFFIAVRGISFNREEQKQLALDLEKITRWLLARENWDSSVSGYKAAFD